MGASRLLIADNDMEYGRALARAISNLHSEFEVAIIRGEELDRHIKNSKIDFHKYSLILIGGFPDRTAEEIGGRIPNSGCVIILTEDAVENLKIQAENPERKFWYIFKYCNVSDLISDLNFLIAYLTGKKRFLKKSFAPELIGFYSICGGAGNTVCAFGTSKELSRHHDKKVLYLSFEEMPATELLIKYNTRNLTIGDYLYYLLEKQNVNLCSHPEGFTYADDYGVESFLPSSGPNDLNDLTQEELIAFLKIISDSCRYDYVVLDFNTRLSGETLFLMNLCSKIIVLQNDNPVSKFKTGKLMAYLSKLSNFNDKDRFLIVVNHTDSPGITEDTEETGCKMICIEQDENSFRFARNHLEIDIYHGFGIGIKKIADEIISAESGKGELKCMENSAQ